MEPVRTPAGETSRVRLTARDLDLLAFLAEHRVVVTEQAAALLGISAPSAGSRLRGLSRAGYLTATQPFHRGPSCFQIKRAGLDAIDSDLRPPGRLDLRSYEHEVGAAWLWLAARNGTFGPLRAGLSERRMRSADGRPEREGLPYGVRLGGSGPGGRERLHYPDLVLVTPDRRRLALELELSSKGRTRREKILAGYAADARIDAVLYLVKDRRIGRSVQESARRLGIGALVHVQQASWRSTRGSAAGRVAARSAAVGSGVARTSAREVAR